MPRDSALAQFLRCRRAQLQPSDVGLPNGDRRRVEGLRREEVAHLAGISVDYYLRIEQGRGSSPSGQVLEALARALKLDDDGAAYIRDLARRPRSVRRPTQAHPDPAIDWLINGWSLSPAHIHDGALNVVSGNALALAVFSNLNPGANGLRALFLDPEMPTFYRNWDGLTAWAVSRARTQAGRLPNPGLAAVIDEVAAKSQHFRTLWSRHDIRHHSRGIMQITHPDVGPMDVNFQHLLLPGTDREVVTYWAQPGSHSERALQQLSATRSPRERCNRSVSTAM